MIFGDLPEQTEVPPRRSQEFHASAGAATELIVLGQVRKGG